MTCNIIFRKVRLNMAAECYNFRELIPVKCEENTDIEIADIKRYTDNRSEYRNIPPLPNNKDYHMFICYIQDDAEDVRIIVDNLERHGVKCCYHERDFLPGQQVLGNINESINRSMSTLIVLSPNFIQSRFCKHEIEQALHAKIEEDYTIIPIKIQQCEVPNVLKNYTHIDAGCIDPADMHTKILDAFISNEWNSRQLVESNGYTLEFLLSKYTISWRWLSLCRYTMIFNAANRRSIRRNGFEISDTLLNEIQQIVRESDLVKYAHINIIFSRMTTFVFFMAGFLYFDVSAAIMEQSFKPTVDKHLATVQHGILYGLLSMFILWLCVIIVHTCGSLGNFKRWKGMTKGLKQRTKLHLMRKLWTKINRKTVDTGKFVVIFKAGKLHIMRFDKKPCRNYFVRRCTEKESFEEHMLPTESNCRYSNNTSSF
ncbi:uncharacterized protein LOC132712947 [Ruditapes philippinarum]|uniref:uncharacterized protein LOC132712947 n=1 Tax=Ruditapes philippinarum TaxID=129788 RepID=UPI00295ABE14|nr:uncharacterized protein LOC132712947 [Ruditapes philippinarum]